ncbi:hypothetical protein ABZW18_10330 [Streptomyces sp. NPDC004647]|uniref:hypothetical protein n=1 Tax=Streptomyces sp. NPDC004647 TaxID=3154671 RepID=UPI0033A8AB79
MDWLKLNVDTPGSAFALGQDAVELQRAVEGYGPLCKPITVQVEFWRLTYTAAERGPVTGGGLGAASPRPNYYFDMAVMKRKQVRFDGRKEHSIPLPERVRAVKLTPCTGSLIAVSVGGPLKEKELPKDISTFIRDGVTDSEDVKFRTRRVAEYGLTAPSAPQVCGPDGTPTADPPAPGRTTSPYDPGDPFGIPTPTYDWDELIDPTPNFGVD